MADTPDTKEPQVSCVTLYGHRIMLPVSRLSWRPCVYGIIHRDSKTDEYGEFLLVKIRLTGRYTLPGGGQDLGETAVTALEREVREETGVSIRDIIEFFTTEEFRFYDPKDQATQVVARIFHAEAVEGSEVVADTGDETAAGAEWVSAKVISHMINIEDPTTKLHEIAIEALKRHEETYLPHAYWQTGPNAGGCGGTCPTCKC